MKYILFILLIPVFCFGQKVKDKPFITDSVGGFTGFKIIYPYTVYTYDRGKLIDSCIVNWDNDGLIGLDTAVSKERLKGKRKK